MIPRLVSPGAAGRQGLTSVHVSGSVATLVRCEHTVLVRGKIGIGVTKDGRRKVVLIQNTAISSHVNSALCATYFSVRHCGQSMVAEGKRVVLPLRVTRGPRSGKQGKSSAR